MLRREKGAEFGSGNPGDAASEDLRLEELGNRVDEEGPAREGREAGGRQQRGEGRQHGQEERREGREPEHTGESVGRPFHRQRKPSAGQPRDPRTDEEAEHPFPGTRQP